MVLNEHHKHYKQFHPERYRLVGDDDDFLTRFFSPLPSLYGRCSCQFHIHKNEYRKSSFKPPVPIKPPVLK